MKVPDGSIYYWMYTQGLKHVPVREISSACFLAGKEIREKDWQNYWNGWYNSSLYHGSDEDSWLTIPKPAQHATAKDYFSMNYSEYPVHPYIGMPEIQNRWVPCSCENKPLIKWSNGCMALADAVAYSNQVYLAENMKGTKMIVLDCDGNHGEGFDEETILFMQSLCTQTHKLSNMEPGKMFHWNRINADIAASFHLTFITDRVIPTMHFPYAHIDIIGNRRNSLRYWKTKVWNGLSPMEMNDAVWNRLKSFIEYRKNVSEGGMNGRYESA